LAHEKRGKQLYGLLDRRDTKIHQFFMARWERGGRNEEGVVVGANGGQRIPFGEFFGPKREQKLRGGVPKEKKKKTASGRRRCQQRGDAAKCALEHRKTGCKKGGRSAEIGGKGTKHVGEGAREPWGEGGGCTTDEGQSFGRSDSREKHSVAKWFERRWGRMFVSVV